MENRCPIFEDKVGVEGIHSFKAVTTIGILTIAMKMEPDDCCFELPFIKTIRQVLNTAVTADAGDVRAMIDEIPTHKRQRRSLSEITNGMTMYRQQAVNRTQVHANCNESCCGIVIRLVRR